MELEDPQDLRARFRKFLNLTNERKQMSKTTIRKGIARMVVTGLTAGVLTAVAPVQFANAHNTTVSTTETNTAVTVGTPGGSMFVATRNSTTGSATNGNYAADNTITMAGSAWSRGLLSKDASSGTAQTATALTGATLAFYSRLASATDAAFVASGGTFTAATSAAGAITSWGTNQASTTSFFDVGTATQVAQLWTAPTTAGTYTISLYVYTPSGAGPKLGSESVGTLAGKITVTTYAASPGGSYSAAYSYCKTNTTSATATSNLDSSAVVENGGAWYIDFDLNDALTNDLDAGNVVATATNGALLSTGASASTPSDGTSSTIVSYTDGASRTIKVVQPTANAPLTTTVTITYNGTTVCTKTVTIRGEVAKITVSNIAVQDLSSDTGITGFMQDGSARTGLFTVQAFDSANNLVRTATASPGTSSPTSAVGSWAVKSASLAGQTLISSVSVNNVSTSTSTSSTGSYGTGIYTCGAVAGEVKNVVMNFTNTGTGNVIESAPFNLRCADDPYTVTASWDKASYTQGEIATLTLSFVDSKGNPANSKTSTGSWTAVVPMMSLVSATGTALNSGGSILSATGTKSYTFTVGGSTAVTAGTYNSVIEFGSLVYSPKATNTYKISTGGDTTSNSDILKSIVALIASINKQIQALQKLILKR